MKQQKNTIIQQKAGLIKWHGMTWQKQKQINHKISGYNVGHNSSNNVTIRSGDTGLSAEQIPEKTDLLLVLKLKASFVT